MTVSLMSSLCIYQIVNLDRITLLSLFPSQSRCIKSLDGVEMESTDQQSGVDLVRRALRTPCSTIAKNAGKDPSIVVEKILSADTLSLGYDALKDEYVDMIQQGEGVGQHWFSWVESQH